jgi:hypothetical protein
MEIARETAPVGLGQRSIYKAVAQVRRDQRALVVRAAEVPAASARHRVVRSIADGKGNDAAKKRNASPKATQALERFEDGLRPRSDFPIRSSQYQAVRKRVARPLIQQLSDQVSLERRVQKVPAGAVTKQEKAYETLAKSAFAIVEDNVALRRVWLHVHDRRVRAPSNSLNNRNGCVQLLPW